MSGKANVLIVLLMVITVTILVAAPPASAASMAGNTDFLYTADYNHDMVHVYNVSMSSFSKVAVIPVEKPSSVVASHDGKRVYVASSGIINSGLYAISTANNTVAAKYVLPDNGAGAIAISKDDRYVYTITATRFIVLDTATGKMVEKTLDTDRYTTLTSASDDSTSYAFFAAPGSSKLYVYHTNEGSLSTYHLNCEIGQITALDSTHLLGTDKLGEINILKFNYASGVEGWSYTPRPIGIASSYFDPYITVNNCQTMAYYTDRENNRVYQVNFNDYASPVLVNTSDWRSPARAVFSSDDSKVFICDDTGVTGLYTANNSQYKYFYGYKALDVAVASVPVSPTSEPELFIPTARPIGTSPKPTAVPASGPSPAESPTAVPATTPTLAILPVIALILGVIACGAFDLRQRR